MTVLGPLQSPAEQGESDVSTTLNARNSCAWLFDTSHFSLAPLIYSINLFTTLIARNSNFVLKSHARHQGKNYRVYFYVTEFIYTIMDKGSPLEIFCSGWLRLPTVARKLSGRSRRYAA